jgi:hypothetical protein
MTLGRESRVQAHGTCGRVGESLRRRARRHTRPLTFAGFLSLSDTHFRMAKTKATKPRSVQAKLGKVRRPVDNVNFKRLC